MKTIYNVVTFLAALVVLAWGGWCTYEHWDVLTGKAPMGHHHHMGMHKHNKCCCKDCKCTDCNGNCCAAAATVGKSSLAVKKCTCKDCKCKDCKCDNCPTSCQESCHPKVAPPVK